ncbi:MAG: Ppx/GppA phosphatase family protein [Balneolaceae bacterium]
MKAAIDIGTNTVLLLIAEVIGGTIHVRHQEQRIPRLGKGVDANGRINSAATNRVIEALKEYKELLMNDFPIVERVVVTATSAVRDAKNREAFLKQVNDETGFQIRLLSGKEEAEWTAAGALSMLKKEYTADAFILDIGGGSTEVAIINNGELEDAHSFDMGSVRFTERFLKNDPPHSNEIEACRMEIRNLFESHSLKISSNTHAVGVAGTLITLAGIILNSNTFEPAAINNYEISLEDLKKTIQIFSTKKHEELLKIAPNLLQGREDIFLAGLLILEGCMTFYGFDQMVVSTGGIRNGAILNA